DYNQDSRHVPGSLLNAAELARSLGVDGKSVARYLDLLVDLLLLRRWPPHWRISNRTGVSSYTAGRNGTGRATP
ncbi:MAG: hypothetical protein R6U25_07355, partial [Alkalispirochaeta sp.]